MTNLRKEAKGRDCQVRMPGICNFNPETTVLAHYRMAGTCGTVIPFRTFGPKILDKPAPLFTGDHYFGKLGWEKGEDTLLIQQRQPLPFHLLAIITTFTSNGG
ncbi:82 prophage-derived uncharacterized protein ybcO [Serratia quinivorans]|uniref:nuclease domain-containing protein n=1 Tax=Serratia quinivorans TaxID=137545 RepID=UPI000F6C1ACD|nr:82 prophage-derived uncharacterized protein ybcO [Serratia quinivorans]